MTRESEEWLDDNWQRGAMFGGNVPLDAVSRWSLFTDDELAVIEHWRLDGSVIARNLRDEFRAELERRRSL